MLFKQIYDNDLAQASYLIGCQASGEAVIIDPRRDIQIYLNEAADNDLTITAVSETHIHADYLSGARELAAATGAALYLSDEGSADWQYRFEHQGLRDGDRVDIGNVSLQVLHTPGHTPEHIAFLVTDGATTDQPGFLLSGDFVFVGDLGRPDLLDEAAGAVDTRYPMARRLFTSLEEKFLSLPDYLQVWPGHGAGSACGKALGAIPSSTVGYERRFAWWASYLIGDDEAGFVEALLAGQPDAPAYFGRMKRWNRAGPPLLGRSPKLEHYQGAALKGQLEQGALLIDTRPARAFAQGFVPGSLNIPVGSDFTNWAAWVIDPEAERRPLIVLAADSERAKVLRDKLQRVGIDTVTGYTSNLTGLTLAKVGMVSPTELGALEDPYILDIRTLGEYQEGHIPGAHQLHGGRVRWHLSELPQERPLVVHCRTGNRVAPVASLLRSVGFENVLELEGSYQGWQAQAASGTPTG